MTTELFQRNFILLWQGHLVSAIGTQLFNVALMYWLLETTGSATTMGLVMSASLLPVAVLSPFTGALVDRLPRKPLIVGADLIRGLLCIGFVASITQTKTDTSTATLFVYVLIGGAAAALFNPALRASLPELVGRSNLAQANGLLQGASSFAVTVGAGVGGFLYVVLGPSILFLINGISFLLSAVSECFVTFPPLEKRPQTHFLKDVRNGLSFIFRDRALRRIVATIACMNITSAPLTITLPMLVRDQYSAGPELLGLLVASQSIGSLAAAGLIASMPMCARNRPRCVWASLLVCATSLLMMINIEFRPLIFAAFAAYGVGMVSFNVLIQSAIQSNTPTALRGRVISSSTSLVAGLMPIAAAITGMVVDAINQSAPIVWAATATIFVGCAVSLATSKPVRRYLAVE